LSGRTWYTVGQRDVVHRWAEGRSTPLGGRKSVHRWAEGRQYTVGQKDIVNTVGQRDIVNTVGQKEVSTHRWAEGG